MRIALTLVATLSLLTAIPALAQTRSLAQDPALDNLRHPAGTEVAAFGTLGRVRKSGEGRRVMLLIPGIGFGDGVWSEFMERHRADYTMYAVTLPGFDGTAPLPMPPEGSKYADTPWMTSCTNAIRKLLDDEKIAKVTVVAHWALASQIALRLALEAPDRIEAVVLISGVLRSYYESPPGMLGWTPDQRAKFAEVMAEKWFKTVTRRTWDDNNFMSYDYAVNPRRGLYLWREAQTPHIAVWIRYLLEFYAIDLSTELKNLKVRTLVVRPGFDDPQFYVEKDANYMRSLCHGSWTGAAELSDRLEFRTIPQSRLFVMFDQPEALDRAITEFLVPAM
jgi:pimeloyl-ACP methyl ester carboxylesterase